jgi:hypothetical protein
VENAVAEIAFGRVALRFCRRAADSPKAQWAKGFGRMKKFAVLWWVLYQFPRAAFRRELNHILTWYNESRQHSTLRCRTSNEVDHGRFPAVRKPRYEPRSRWPRGSPCACPWALVRGKPGVTFELHVEFQGGHKHLPIVSLRHAA